MNTIENFHSIECVYHGPTNTRGSYVKLTSHRFKDSVNIAYDYSKNDIVEMAREYLTGKGYDIAGMCESKKGYMVLSRTFKGLKA